MFFEKKMLFGNFIYQNNHWICDRKLPKPNVLGCWRRRDMYNLPYGILSFWNGKIMSMISLILKCDYENTLNFEASMNPSMAMDGFVEEKYDPMCPLILK